MDALWEQRVWAEGVVLNPGPLALGSHVLRAAVSASRVPVVEVLLAPAKGRATAQRRSLPQGRLRGPRRGHRGRGLPRGARAAGAGGEPLGGRAGDEDPGAGGRGRPGAEVARGQGTGKRGERGGGACAPEGRSGSRCAGDRHPPQDARSGPRRGRDARPGGPRRKRRERRRRRPREVVPVGHARARGRPGRGEDARPGAPPPPPGTRRPGAGLTRAEVRARIADRLAGRLTPGGARHLGPRGVGGAPARRGGGGRAAGPARGGAPGALPGRAAPGALSDDAAGGVDGGAGMNARAVAIDVLARVEATDAYLNVVLDQRLAEAPLRDPRDAALVTELCVRRDAPAARRSTGSSPGFSDRRLAALEDRVLAALRVGAYQIFHSRVPRRAAVSETVEGLKQLGLSRAAGFVNAVLRKVAALEAHSAAARVGRRRAPLGAGEPPALAGGALAPPVRPGGRRGHAGGEQRAAAGDACGPMAAPGRGRRWGRSSPRRASRPCPPSAHRWASGCRRPDRWRRWSGTPRAGSRSRTRRRSWSASTPPSPRAHGCSTPAPRRAARRATSPRATRCWRSTSTPAKLEKIRSEARRLRLDDRIEVLTHDATQPFPESIGRVDAVLLDAPCTGLGTLRRHPELRWRREEADLAASRHAPARASSSAARRSCRPGGLLVYAVCSTEPEEGQDQVELFLRSHPDFTLETPAVGRAARLAPGPGGAAHLARARGHGRLLRRAAASPGVTGVIFRAPPDVWTSGTMPAPSRRSP